MSKYLRSVHKPIHQQTKILGEQMDNILEVRTIRNIYGFEVLEANDGITIQQTTDLDDEMQAVYID